MFHKIKTILVYGNSIYPDDPFAKVQNNTLQKGSTSVQERQVHQEFVHRDENSNFLNNKTNLNILLITYFEIFNKNKMDSL